MGRVCVAFWGNLGVDIVCLRPEPACLEGEDAGEGDAADEVARRQVESGAAEDGREGVGEIVGRERGEAGVHDWYDRVQIHGYGSAKEKYTAAVEHEIAGLAVSEAEEDGECAGEDGEGHGVVHLHRRLGEDRVVRGGDPQVLIGDGGLPQRQGVGDPVGEELAEKETGNTHYDAHS